MADVLAAFEALEKEERKQNPKKGPKATNTKFRNPLVSNNTNRSNSTSSNNNSNNNNSSNQRQGRSARPRSLPPQSDPRPQSTSPTNNNFLAPSYSGGNGHSERSPSVASGRRISFVEGPRPPSTQHRLRILTKKESLASGFQYDPKLNKYSVPQKEWDDFCDGVVERAELSRAATWAWKFHKSEAVKKVKRDMQYEGSDMKRYFNAWNRNFRRKGFTVSIEVPGPPKIRDDDTPEQKEQVRKESKFFRMVVTPNAEKAASIYSRTSSLTRGVSNEGMALQPSKTSAEDDGEDEKDDQAQAEETEMAQEEVKEALSTQTDEIIPKEDQKEAAKD